MVGKTATVTSVTEKSGILNLKNLEGTEVGVGVGVGVDVGVGVGVGVDVGFGVLLRVAFGVGVGEGDGDSVTWGVGEATSVVTLSSFWPFWPKNK